MTRLEELGIAGPVDDVLRRELNDDDVDAAHSIGLAGPWTPELLRRMLDLGGVQRVAGFVHGVGAAGAWDPGDLADLMAMEPSAVRATIEANGWWAQDPAELVERLRSAGL